MIKEDLEIIEKRDEVIYSAICLCINHIANTYDDKYNPEDCVMNVNTKELLLSDKTGKVINSYQILKYLQRYNTDGMEKSNLVKDLYKGVHYFVFEIARRIKNKTL